MSDDNFKKFVASFYKRYTGNKAINLTTGKSLSDKTDTNKKNMLALNKTLGVVTTACDVCGISRDTHYRYLKSDARYASAVKEINDIALDFVEAV